MLHISHHFRLIPILQWTSASTDLSIDFCQSIKSSPRRCLFILIIDSLTGIYRITITYWSKRSVYVSLPILDGQMSYLNQLSLQVESLVERHMLKVLSETGEVHEAQGHLEREQEDKWWSSCLCLHRFGSKTWLRWHRNRMQWFIKKLPQTHIRYLIHNKTKKKHKLQDVLLLWGVKSQSC